MRYFIDIELTKFCGNMITLALVREDKASLYLQYLVNRSTVSKWSLENVLPIINSSPVKPVLVGTMAIGARHIAGFLAGDPKPHIIADWADDIRCFCQAIMVSDDHMIAIPNITMEIVRLDSYINGVPEGFIRHNAWFDAMALRNIFMDGNNDLKT